MTGLRCFTERGNSSVNAFGFNRILPLNAEGVPQQSPGFAYSRTLGTTPLTELNAEGVPQ